MIIKDKEQNTCIIIDIAVSCDTRIELKEKEKIYKYRDLAIELKRLWKTKVKDESFWITGSNSKEDGEETERY